MGDQLRVYPHPLALCIMGYTNSFICKQWSEVLSDYVQRRGAVSALTCVCLSARRLHHISVGNKYPQLHLLYTVYVL